MQYTGQVMLIVPDAYWMLFHIRLNWNSWNSSMISHNRVLASCHFSLFKFVLWIEEQIQTKLHLLQHGIITYEKMNLQVFRSPVYQTSPRLKCHSCIILYPVVLLIPKTYISEHKINFFEEGYFFKWWVVFNFFCPYAKQIRISVIMNRIINPVMNGALPLVVMKVVLPLVVMNGAIPFAVASRNMIPQTNSIDVVVWRSFFSWYIPVSCPVHLWALTTIDLASAMNTEEGRLPEIKNKNH